MRRVAAAAAVACVLYLLLGPPHDGDFAAQTARAALFTRSGLVPWFAGWYGGFHVGGYSTLSPPLMSGLGPAGLGVLSLLLTAAAAALLLRSAAVRRPVAGALALTAAALADLLSGRVTFAAGAAVALGAIFLCRRGAAPLAALAAAAASLASPVDGLYTGVAAAAIVLADPVRRPAGWWLGGGAAAGLAWAVLAFPDPGYQPFTTASMLPALGLCLLFVALPVGRTLRVASLLAALVVLAAYLVHSPLGSNAARVPLLLAAPLAVATLPGRWRVLGPVLALCLPLPLHQLAGDLSAAHDPAAHRAFYAPLLSRLAADPQLRTHRLEVVEPRTHWQVAYLEPAVTLARGWERQLDESLNPAFYRPGALTAVRYRKFLDRSAVAAVALPRGTPIDFGSRSEAALVRAGLPYLHRVWSDPHWSLYQVSRPAPLALGDGARITALTDVGVHLATRGPGTVRLALRYSPYLQVNSGCVRRGRRGEVVLRLARGGRHVLAARWSLAGVDHAVLGGGGCGSG